ncbi:MAG: hypothetical protein NT094_02090, partial [Candidatus Staskawiczbacteria bacterium]|nr:hypothetical protein [Candidatus Staskawiczbacteria bacterium]
MIINRKILLLPLITLFILSGLFLVPDIAEGSPCGWAPDYLQPGGLASGQCCNGWSQSTIPATYHTWCCGSGTGDTNCGNCSPTARSTCTPPPCGSLNTCSSCWGDNCRACPTDQVDITISWNENRDKDTIYTPCGSIDFSGSVVTDACSNDPLSLHLSFYVETAAAEGEKANRFTFFCGGDTFGNAFEITNCILPGDIVENPQIRMDYNWTFTWWQKSTGICTGTQTYVPNPPVYHTITAESECADNVIGNYALGETFPRPRPYPYYYCGTGSSLVGWGPPSLPDVGGATVDWH